MPINAGPEYFKAQERYQKARTREEKIAALEEVIRCAPKHKGAQTLLGELKSKLAKLRKIKISKSARHSIGIQKLGDVQVAILGLTQSGKSTLLSQLTNAKPKIAAIPYTTTKPEVGVAEWKGVKIQLIEIPSIFDRQYMSIAHSADAIIFLYDSTLDKDIQDRTLDDLRERFKLSSPVISLHSKTENIEPEILFEKLWSNLRLIKIYTKEPGKKAMTKALVLKKGSTVRDAAKNLHQDFLKFFRFARVWGKSAKFSGEKVGLEHKLEDNDVLEIRIS